MSSPRFERDKGGDKMEGIYNQLEELRTEIETLKEENWTKSGLMEGLKSQIETLKDENRFKYNPSDEPKQKESAFKQLILAHETLKNTLKEERERLEREKRDLMSALDKSDIERTQLLVTVKTYHEEILGLKKLLSESQKKCAEIEEMDRAGREVKWREELLAKSEMEKNNLEEQLKWKSEQFSHLEQAHELLQLELNQIKRERESERLELFSKINELQANLDSKTRLGNELSARLGMCSEALAREESKRKILETELREMEKRYDNVVMDFEAARLAVESVTVERDREIGSLRELVANKSMDLKELGFETTRLEREHEELKVSLKEYRESEIGGVERLKRIRVLEKAHKGCEGKIRARESELERVKMELSSREREFRALQDELDWSYSGLVEEKAEKEEMGVAFTVIKSKYEDLCVNFELKREVLGNVERQNALVREKERLAGVIKERERKIEELDECVALLREENGRLGLEFEGSISRNEERENALVREKERLVGVIEERERKIEELDECVALLREETGRLGSELEGNISRNVERENDIVREKERLVDVIEERERKIKELDECIALLREEKASLGLELEGNISRIEERETALQRENDVLVRKIQELKQGIDLLKEDNTRFGLELEANILRNQERESALLREKGSLVRKVEELKQDIDLLREDNTRLGLELEANILGNRERENALVREKKGLICIIEEKSVIVGELEKDNARLGLETKHLNEETERLGLELEANTSKNKEREEVLVREKESLGEEISRLRVELEGSIFGSKEREKSLARENMGLVHTVQEKNEIIENIEQSLEEMVKSCLISEYEIQFNNVLMQEMETKMESVKQELESKVELLLAQLEREIFELNSDIGSLIRIDGEIRANFERVLSKMGLKEERERVTGLEREKSIERSRALPAYDRPPLKEYNF